MDFSSLTTSAPFRTPRAFAQPRAGAARGGLGRRGIFPREVIARAGELGFCGLYTPETYGGLGLVAAGRRHRV